MLRTALLALALFAVAGCESTFHCSKQDLDSKIPQSICYNANCTDAIQEHIQEEFNAAFNYLVMGAYFASQTVNRPGIAKFLLSAASEERGHAILMLDYLNKRGIKLNAEANTYKFKFDVENPTNKEILDNDNPKHISIDYRRALVRALEMEQHVTQKIYEVVQNCENDYHGADVFTNPILDEQHEGIRHLQGAIKIFDNLAEGAENEYTKYAVYLFDMKLLKGEIAAH